MSVGVAPKDFVQQVFYMQEKVLLDFDPVDDKYKEVLMEANFVLQELQKEEDWSWLRDTKALGLTPISDTNQTISKFDLGSNVYKVSSLFGDCVRLYAHKPLPPENERTSSFNLLDYIIPHDYICVPYISIGMKNKFPTKEVSWFGKPNVATPDLGAFIEGNKLVFNRHFFPFENDRIVVIDYQRLLAPIHICTSACSHNCSSIESAILTDIPDPNYVVIKTAYYHAMGSPTAQGMLSSLSDMAQKILSAMRENNALATTPDYMEYETPGFIGVI